MRIGRLNEDQLYGWLLQEYVYGIQREVINKMMDCAIILIIDTLLDSIRQCFGTTEEQINELVCVFISKLPEAWRCRFTAPQAG